MKNRDCVGCKIRDINFTVSSNDIARGLTNFHRFDLLCVLQINNADGTFTWSEIRSIVKRIIIGNVQFTFINANTGRLNAKSDGFLDRK